MKFHFTGLVLWNGTITELEVRDTLDMRRFVGEIFLAKG